MNESRSRNVLTCLWVYKRKKGRRRGREGGRTLREAESQREREESFTDSQKFRKFVLGFVALYFKICLALNRNLSYLSGEFGRQLANKLFLLNKLEVFLWKARGPIPAIVSRVPAGAVHESGCTRRETSAG